jgi:hypothetical protein
MDLIRAKIGHRRITFIGELGVATYGTSVGCVVEGAREVGGDLLAFAGPGFDANAIDRGALYFCGGGGAIIPAGAQVREVLIEQQLQGASGLPLFG